MASWTAVYMTRKRLKAKKAGRARKLKIARDGSTPSRAAFFGDAAPAKK
jgi:hypothetical protein